MVEYYLKTSTGDIVCPYDKTHVIREERLSRHLIKCAKNVATSKNFTSCEFNYCHKIKRGEGAEHYSRCVHKEIEDEWQRKGKLCLKGGDTSLPKYDEIHIDGENWDEELEPFCSEKYSGPIPEIKKNV